MNWKTEKNIAKVLKFIIGVALMIHFCQQQGAFRVYTRRMTIETLMYNKIQWKIQCAQEILQFCTRVVLLLLQRWWQRFYFTYGIDTMYKWRASATLTIKTTQIFLQCAACKNRQSFNEVVKNFACLFFIHRSMAKGARARFHIYLVAFQKVLLKGLKLCGVCIIIFLKKKTLNDSKYFIQLKFWEWEVNCLWTDDGTNVTKKRYGNN